VSTAAANRQMGQMGVYIKLLRRVVNRSCNCVLGQLYSAQLCAMAFQSAVPPQHCCGSAAQEGLLAPAGALFCSSLSSRYA
jgi:hypothetical protein